ncbi:MAG: Gfo/Idh/MocA family oxidoreductase [Planctomycetes bacterium]|nr:Gfo/Idh/MocA family oxidoreductase [Planctomycetota bacterium]
MNIEKVTNDSGEEPDAPSSVSRRTFVKSSLAAGAGMMLSSASKGQGQNTGAAPKVDDLNVAIIGVGTQGSTLIASCMNIEGLRFKAVCDIWDFNRNTAQRRLKVYKHDCKAYDDFKEMLAAEKDLDAVIVATPDFWHAPHAIACMKAGLHVYCEKMMSNTHEGAEAMVKAQHETGQILQIGHQRRSNPRYLQAKEELIDKAKLLGRITTINGQWNRSVSDDLGWAPKHEIIESRLNEFGFANMKEFRNWRWYKKYGGGPISDLGAHQIDIYNWFLGTPPRAVMANGGIDFYTDKEWWDTVMAIYDYETPNGMVRAFYQVLTTTRAGVGYFEYFMGTQGSLRMSENPGITRVFREATAPSWQEWERAGLMTEALKAKKGPSLSELAWWDRMRGQSVVDARATAELDAFVLSADLGDKKIHQPHLENFFAAIRDGVPLNCPVEIGYETDMTVMKVNDAIEQEKKLYFEPGEFTA